MTCVHLQQLYKLCQENELKLGGTDLIHIVCRQCGEQEVCPAMLTDEYDAKEAEREGHATGLGAGSGPAAGQGGA